MRRAHAGSRSRRARRADLTPPRALAPPPEWPPIGRCRRRWWDREERQPAFPAGAVVLLCHKFRCLLRTAQHGQRESVVARAATNLRRIVAIEFGTWRSGRNGGSSGLVTFA